MLKLGLEIQARVKVVLYCLGLMVVQNGKCCAGVCECSQKAARALLTSYYYTIW